MNEGVSQRLFRGYGPLLGFAAIFAAISLLVPTVKQAVITEKASSSADQSGSGAGGAGGADELADGTTDTVAGDSATSSTAATGTGSGGSVSGQGGSSGTKVAGASKSAGSASGVGRNANAAKVNAPPGKVVGCGDKQVPADDYSPPCYAWGGGDNGGSTSPGVTADKITLSIRVQAFDNGFLDALSKLAKAKIPKEDRSQIEATIRALVQFINENFEFYGRKLDLKIYEGAGDIVQEVAGGGQAGAERDAEKVKKEFNAFADASGISPSYAEALAKRGIISSGAPYMSRDWLTRLRPYVWSPLTDCSTVVETVGSYYLARMAGKPAQFAGGALANQPRKVGIVAPENTWYQECVNAGIKIISDGGRGGDLVQPQTYKIDLASIIPQADSILAKLKSDNVTTVVCGCDPIMLSSLTAKATGQGYFPEWVETGVGFTDQDQVGLLMDAQQWKHAFGVSFAGPTKPIQSGFGYQAAKSIMGNAQPSFASDLIYANLSLLAIGIQMAGPNLTPETFEAGMFKYPTRFGQFGTWKFGPRDYTTSQDAREVYWDPRVRSAQSNENGSWMQAGDKRYPVGNFPPGDPKTCGC